MSNYHLENAIFHFLKKHYFIGAYFPYSFIKAHFPNESTGDIRKALNWLIDDKIIERLGKGEYKFIKDIFPYPEIKEANIVVENQPEKEEIDKWLIEVIIQTIKKFKDEYGLYPSMESIYLYSRPNSNNTKEKVFQHIQYMIENFIVVQDEDGKIIPYYREYLKSNPSEKEFDINNEVRKIQTCFDKLKIGAEHRKKIINQDIDINTEIRKIYGYITKKNKELKKEIEQDIEKGLYSVGKEIGEFHGNVFAKLTNELNQIKDRTIFEIKQKDEKNRSLMAELNQINKRANYQAQQKDEKIRSLNDKIKTLRKDVNTLIQETKSLKCLKTTLPDS